MILPQALAEAVAHWLRFEELCGRQVLFSERHMAHAIGQFLLARYGNNVVPECSHPVLPRKLIDFAVHDPNSNNLVDVIETKLVNDKRDFRQEIYNDLVRLELAANHTADTNAWMLIAGWGEHFKQKVVCEPEDGQLSPLDGILHHYKQEEPQVVEIAQSNAPERALWQRSFQDLKLADSGIEGPACIRTQLQGRWLFDAAVYDDNWMCMVWQVSSSNPRETCVLE